MQDNYFTTRGATMKKYLKLVDIIETPDHFYYGGVDFPHATCERAKVEKLDEGMVRVTKSFIVNSYTYQKSMDQFFDHSQKGE